MGGNVWTPYQKVTHLQTPSMFQVFSLPFWAVSSLPFFRYGELNKRRWQVCQLLRFFLPTSPSFCATWLTGTHCEGKKNCLKKSHVLLNHELWSKAPSAAIIFVKKRLVIMATIQSWLSILIGAFFSHIPDDYWIFAPPILSQILPNRSISHLIFLYNNYLLGNLMIFYLRLFGQNSCPLTLRSGG